MPYGSMVLSKVLYDGLTPEMQGLIMDFISEGGRSVNRIVTEKEYVYTLNHPDFAVHEVGHRPVSHVLEFKRVYDPDTNSERPRLSKLYGWSEDHKVRLVKTYA